MDKTTSNSHFSNHNQTHFQTNSQCVQSAAELYIYILIAKLKCFQTTDESASCIWSQYYQTNLQQLIKYRHKQRIQTNGHRVPVTRQFIHTTAEALAEHEHLWLETNAAERFLDN